MKLIYIVMLINISEQLNFNYSGSSNIDLVEDSPPETCYLTYRRGPKLMGC